MSEKNTSVKNTMVAKSAASSAAAPRSPQGSSERAGRRHGGNNKKPGGHSKAPTARNQGISKADTSVGVVTTKIVDFSIKQLLDSGVHFGHRTNYWNPKMSKFIYGIRNNTHIFNLQETALRLNHALAVIKKVASMNGKILFVGTKKQAQDAVASSAKRCGQYYVNYRWLGGMLTNWNTVSASLKTLLEYEELLNNPNLDITKKERLSVEKKRLKLENALGGIKNLGGKPDLIFVIDCRNELLAVKEANKLGIPVVGIVDSNTNPDGIDYIIPGNDDATKAIELYCYLASEAALQGLAESLSRAGADVSPEEALKVANTQQLDNELVEAFGEISEVKPAAKAKVARSNQPREETDAQDVEKKEVKKIEIVTKSSSPKTTVSALKAAPSKATLTVKKTAEGTDDTKAANKDDKEPKVTAAAKPATKAKAAVKPAAKAKK